MTATLKISIQIEPFNAGFEQELLTQGRKDIGAVVAFTGLCRSENESLKALELEHYPGMAEAQMKLLAGEAANRWDLLSITLIHCYGLINVGEPIVLVIAASKHRHNAFKAAEFMMDYLKSTAPFWKKEHRIDGSKGEWITAKDTDDAALERWSGLIS